MYLLRDLDNRGPDGEPFEARARALSEFVGYVDGPLRSDVRSPEGIAAVDAAIAALRDGAFAAAEARLRAVGVYLSETDEVLEQEMRERLEQMGVDEESAEILAAEAGEGESDD